ncbi:hypothetical protein [Bradyrhizobium brasilense]|uniref:hypothetical protein n=1 Tax=Bradyrhizobium brasilense TaxID=1419277 RepID=UPI001E5216CB|nr:hypothetical protein [Bradyrhizobium brasilense]
MSGFHSVEKIDGTSMAATGTLFDDVPIAERKGEDLYNRAFVVSAYAGMTDVLLEHKETYEPGIYARFVADDGADGWRQAMADSDIAWPGLVFDALRALDNARIDVIATRHQIRNADVQFVVTVCHFDASARVLHRVPVEADGEAEGRRAA